MAAENPFSDKNKKKAFDRDSILGLSLWMNSILIVSLLFLGTHGSVGRPASTNGLETVWHGGHPTEP